MLGSNTLTIIETFDDQWIEQIGPLDTPCWVWLRACKGKEAASGGGYGCFRHNGKTIGAHRFSYERIHGPIPDGMQVMHQCHNTKCVNPAHLKIGSNNDNQAHKARDGRTSSRLSADQVLTIRKLYDEGVLQREIAEQYALHQADVSNIVNRKYWKHV